MEKETPDSIKNKIDKLISDKGLSLRAVSLQIGRGETYLQQFISRTSPKRLSEQDREKLARILEVDEQELSDLPLKKNTTNFQLNKSTLIIIFKLVEEWLNKNNAELSPEDKADLVASLYEMIAELPDELTGQEKSAKIIDFMEFYKRINKKAQ